MQAIGLNRRSEASPRASRAARRSVSRISPSSMFARCTCLIGRPKASAIASSTRLSFNPMRRSPVMILRMYFDPRGSARRSSSSSTKRFCKGPRRALNCSNAACKTCNESSAAGGRESLRCDWKSSSVVAPKSPCLRYRASRLPASCPVRRLTASQIKEPPTPKIRSSRRGKGRPVKNRAASAASTIKNSMRRIRTIWGTEKLRA